MNRVSAPIAPPFWTYCLQIDRLLSTPPIPLGHGLQVHPQTRSIMASKCISKLARSQASSASPKLLDHGFQTRSITASKCISNNARSWPPSASPNSLDHSLQVHPQTRSIAASKWISKLARSRPPSASPKSLDYGLGVYPRVHLIVIFRRTSKLGKIESVFRIMRWCLSTPGSPTYILPVAESISIIPVSPNVYILRDLENTCHIMK